MTIYSQLSKNSQAPPPPADDGLEEYFSDDEELKNARSRSNFGSPKTGNNA